MQLLLKKFIFTIIISFKHNLYLLLIDIGTYIVIYYYLLVAQQEKNSVGFIIIYLLVTYLLLYVIYKLNLR